ncbi:DUF4174 domain-containing protein [uncultured Sulfitobacter sp.]|uniref:DUF4174 domain-containing protein n=1 Tax=uncultured Sulfitobacter sp. TaxID=191468 RepID=UPI0026191D50|nr:DUF4174 domain-containing protein [uncultured Sulfitobacter sp.]
MKPYLIAVFMGAFAAVAYAQSNPTGASLLETRIASETDLSEFKWIKRPVIIFADSAHDPAFVEQMEFLRAEAEQLAVRDVVVIVDTDPDARSAIRLRMRPRGFMLTLMGKDGNVKLRKPFPWDVREITRSIDKMSIRQREIRDNKQETGG